MYGKLILQNVKRSIKDYLIYIVTMVICVTLFYAFLSISSSFYHPGIGAEYDIAVLNDGMKLAICGITLLLFFLIKYVNHYMLLHRKKEFAIQAAMGMEQRVIGWLFFAETLSMGIVSIILGILLGAVLSQFIAAMLLTSYGQPYRFSWMLFPDTAALTICFFVFTLLIVGTGNIRTIRRIKIIDMLYADRKNEPSVQKSRYMHVIAALYYLLLICMTATGISQIHYYYDSRFPIAVRVMYWGNLAAPALSLAAGILYIFLRIWPHITNYSCHFAENSSLSAKSSRFAQVKRGNFQTYLAAAAVLSIVNIIFAASVPMLQQMYYLSGNDGTLRLYLLYLLFDIIFLICCIIYLASSLLVKWKEKYPAYKYKNANLFFFGQIISKLNTTSKIMTLICLTLVLSCCLFAAMPALTSWSEGYLESRAKYDLQIASYYNSVYEEANLPKDSYEPVTDFLATNDIEITYDCTLDLYLTRHDEFYNRVKLDFPVVAISLSDYNTLRKMQGCEPITLKDKEFTTQ
ncbi:MAG: ABC transporter permease, partial [Ruminococcus flavefaciens]|nr:ABC transporter permease [Ruminococcus flavefaciens]